MRGNLFLVVVTTISTYLLISGYDAGTVSGLFRMGIGAIIASFVLRQLFDIYGAAGADANRPSEFIDGMPFDGYQPLESLDPNRRRT
ncbi:MAG: hypothetical protein JWL76_758 [Thermoleophilia bacterium]|nr:hypothetical protein [Thermoleophilia bacterium]